MGQISTEFNTNEFYARSGIELHLGEPVLSIDKNAGRISTSQGIYEFGKLILATGSSARKLELPGSNLDGVHTLRSLEDTKKLKLSLQQAFSIVIIGGGFIGLEVAATAAKAGKSVTVVEASARVLSRSAPAVIAEYLKDVHVSEGVSFRCESIVERFEGNSGKVCGVRLSDGSLLPADMILVGVGGIGNALLAAESGLDIAADGILIDEFCRTSHPDIYAIGDVASFMNRYMAKPARLEAISSAADQAKVAALHVLGKPTAAYHGVPTFWSDQFTHKFQAAGMATAGSRFVVRGVPSSGKFSVLELVGRKLHAAYMINNAHELMAARKIIERGEELEYSIVADASVPLDKCLAV